MKNKKINLLCLLILLSAGFTIQAQTEIRTAEELAALNDNKTSLAGNYILMNDLTIDNWTPVGNLDEKNQQGFSGTFDGNGHTITINSFQNPARFDIGLFGSIEKKGVVKNLCVAGNVSYTSNKPIMYIGGITGVNFGLITCCVSKIEAEGNIISDGNTEKIKTTFFGFDAGAYGGCIAGVNMGAITNCYSTGSISVSGDRLLNIAGGIAGGNGKNVGGGIGISFGSGGGSISVSQANVNVSDVISNCYSTASVYSKKTKSSGILEIIIAGGITGPRFSTGMITACVALNKTIKADGINKAGQAVPLETGLIGKMAAAYRLFYNKDIVLGRYINGQEHKSKDYSEKNGAVDLYVTQEQSWWRYPDGLTEKQRNQQFGFNFGETEQSPWVWDEVEKRPILYWEKTGEN